MSIDDRQLQYFVDVATFRSINKAAEHRNIAQPALSRRMRQLEHELGAKLFSRSNMGIELTAAGQRLLEHAAKLIGEFDRITSILNSTDRAPSAKLLLGMPPGVSLMLLDRITSSVYRDIDGVILQVKEGGSQELLEMLISREADIAIVSERDFAGQLQAEHFYSERLFFVSAATPRLAPSEIALPFALPDLDQDFFATVRRALAQLGRAEKVDMYMATISSIKILVDQGLACTIGPYSGLIKELAKADWNITPVPGMMLERYVVWRRGAEDDPIIARTLAILRDVIGKVAQTDAAGHLLLPKE
jgi:LysR family transcriptional regulator, nitrogen assimilation regulatory protein